uniref:Uncharacterized protein n=1 Tax=Klebsiella pneumoniae TaxID=573 RepID=A0A6M4NU29_KLEPN|nr:hypothetical protein [Klebsiella pneumoniae]
MRTLTGNDVLAFAKTPVFLYSILIFCKTNNG